MLLTDVVLERLVLANIWSLAVLGAATRNDCSIKNLVVLQIFFCCIADVASETAPHKQAFMPKWGLSKFKVQEISGQVLVHAARACRL